MNRCASPLFDAMIYFKFSHALEYLSLLTFGIVLRRAGMRMGIVKVSAIGPYQVSIRIGRVNRLAKPSAWVIQLLFAAPSLAVGFVRGRSMPPSSTASGAQLSLERGLRRPK